MQPAVPKGARYSMSTGSTGLISDPFLEALAIDEHGSLRVTAAEGARADWSPSQRIDDLATALVGATVTSFQASGWSSMLGLIGRHLQLSESRLELVRTLMAISPRPASLVDRLWQDLREPDFRLEHGPASRG